VLQCSLSSVLELNLILPPKPNLFPSFYFSDRDNFGYAYLNKSCKDVLET
jgi:hypothetical protein